MLGTALAWLCIAPASPAIAQGSPEQFDFLWRLHSGTATRYRLSVDFSADPTEVHVDAELVQTVRAGKPDGTFDVSSATKGVRVTTNGDAEPMDDGPIVLEKYASNGRRLSKSEDPDPFSASVGHATDFLPPATAVKVGDKWTVSVNPSAHLDYRLLGMEKRGGISLLHLRYAYAETSGKLPVHADGYFYIDRRDFSIVECQATIHNARMSPDLPPGNVTVRMVKLAIRPRPAARG